MSAIIGSSSSAAPLSFWIRDVISLLAGQSRPQARRYAGLEDLPDYLLLDIGVDPRDVPAQTEETIVRPDLVNSRLGARKVRTAARY